LTSNLQKGTYTVEEAAAILGVGRSTAYEAANNGDIPAVRIGRRLLVPKLALQNLLNNGNGARHADNLDE
jgi:excisionase family DNA binding protein